MDSAKSKNNQIKAQIFKMNWTLTLTLLGVIAAWLPFLYERLNPVIIKGKLISQYYNGGKSNKIPKAMFLFKLSVVSLNQSFDLKDIDVDIKYENNVWTHNSSQNSRETTFTLEKKIKKLNVPESSFLNNLTILKKDKPEVGYIFTTTPLFANDKVIEIKFLFKSFNGKVKTLSFKSEEVDELKMLYDDSIWTLIDSAK